MPPEFFSRDTSSDHIIRTAASTHQAGAEALSVDNQINKDPIKADSGVGLVPLTISDAAASKPEHQRLINDANNLIKDQARRESFEHDLKTFEQRQGELQRLYEKQGLSKTDAASKAGREITFTCGQIAWLMEQGDKPAVPINHDQRVQIAAEILHQAALPSSIDQGQHLTCNVSSVEERTYTRYPSHAAALVVSVATSGQYRTPGGNEIILDAGSLKPDDESSHDRPYDGERSYASQLFQITAVNVYWQTQHANVRYEQHVPDPGNPGDTGERLMDTSTNPPKEYSVSAWHKYWSGDVPHRRPGLIANDIAGINNSINGVDEKDGFIAYGDRCADDKIITIKSEQELQNALANAKEHGKLPVTIQVYTGNEPFYSDSGAGTAGGSGGWHVVNVTDYHAEAPAKVEIDNWWGSSADHLNINAISVHDLFLATRNTADSTTDMQFMDDQLTSLHRKAKITPEDETTYEHMVEQRLVSMANNMKAQKSDNSIDWNGYGKAWGELKAIINDLPPAERMKLIKLEWQQGILSDSDCADWSTQQCIDINKQAESHPDEISYSELDSVGDTYGLLQRSLPQELRERMDKHLHDSVWGKQADPQQGFFSIF